MIFSLSFNILDKFHQASCHLPCSFTLLAILDCGDDLSSGTNQEMLGFSQRSCIIELAEPA